MQELSNYWRRIKKKKEKSVLLCCLLSSAIYSLPISLLTIHSHVSKISFRDLLYLVLTFPSQHLLQMQQPYNYS